MPVGCFISSILYTCVQDIQISIAISPSGRLVIEHTIDLLDYNSPHICHCRYAKFNVFRVLKFSHGHLSLCAMKIDNFHRPCTNVL